MKQSADDNLKFDEKSRKFFKWVENTVGKGEIARYEQFLLFPQCFQKACFPGASKGVIVWKWVNKSSQAFLTLGKRPLENIVRKTIYDVLITKQKKKKECVNKRSHTKQRNEALGSKQTHLHKMSK